MKKYTIIPDWTQANRGELEAYISFQTGIRAEVLGVASLPEDELVSFAESLHERQRNENVVGASDTLTMFGVAAGLPSGMIAISSSLGKIPIWTEHMALTVYVGTVLSGAFLAAAGYVKRREARNIEQKIKNVYERAVDKIVKPQIGGML